MNMSNNVTIRFAVAAAMACLSINSEAQDKSQEWDAGAEDWKNNRWSAQFSFGLNAFRTDGITMSRNQINYNEVNTEHPIAYNQESRIAGICYEGTLDYKLFRSGNLGLVLNAFKDDDEYLSDSKKYYTAGQIEMDSLNKLTIRNLQSYLNIGLRYEHILYHSKSNAHQIAAGLAIGLAVNRTPDRSEYDYNDQEHFIAMDTLDGEVWRLTHTRFENGFFMSPAIAYIFSFNKNNSLRISMCQFLQWHQTSQELKILNVNSSGTRGQQSYSLRAFQFKIGYSF